MSQTAYNANTLVTTPALTRMMETNTGVVLWTGVVGVMLGVQFVQVVATGPNMSAVPIDLMSLRKRRKELWRICHLCIDRLKIWILPRCSGR